MKHVTITLIVLTRLSGKHLGSSAIRGPAAFASGLAYNVLQ
jgi:hypothetical protein